MTTTISVDMKSSPAETIRLAREAQALSQEAFARTLGVSVRTVARWESGISRPSALALDKLNLAGLERS
jgi:DNA-binding transcriptional regulator YiaG